MAIDRYGPAAEPVRLLVTDLDDTTWNWFEAWHASFSAMVDELVRLTGIRRQVLLDEIRPIHQRYRTSEYSHVAQEIPSVLSMFDGDVDRLLRDLDPAIHAYRKARKQTLRLYPDVKATLEKLKRRGVRVVAYSDSLQYYSAWRLERLGLDGVVDVLYCPPDHELPSNALVPPGGAARLLEVTELRATPEGLHKPQPEILKSIIEDEGVEPLATVYIGDSGSNDIAMASAAGVASVLASYKQIPDEAYELLRAVSHWPDEKVSTERAMDEAATPTFEATRNFGELMDFIDFV